MGYLQELKKQNSTLMFAYGIARRQINYLESKTKVNFKELKIKEQEIYLTQISTLSYLKIFWGYFNFLKRQSFKDMKDGDIQFHLPLLRTMIEIYAQLLYFLNQTPKEKLALFLYEHLGVLAKSYNLISKSTLLNKEYTRLLGIWSKLIDHYSLIIPNNIEDCKKSTWENINGTFPKFEQILSSSYFKDLSQKTFASWSGDSADYFYDKYYRITSLYSHRGMANQIEYNGPNNERFWIIQSLYVFSVLMFELLDAKVFDNKYYIDVDTYIRKLSVSHIQFTEIWETRRK